MRSSSLVSVVPATPSVIFPVSVSRYGGERNARGREETTSPCAGPGDHTRVTSLSRSPGPRRHPTTLGADPPVVRHFSLAHVLRTFLSLFFLQVVKVSGVALLALFRGKKEKPRT